MRKILISLFSIIMMAVMLTIGLFSASLFTDKAVPTASISTRSSQQGAIIGAALAGTRITEVSNMQIAHPIQLSSYLAESSEPKLANADPFIRLEHELRSIIMVETDENYITDAYETIDDVRSRLLQIMSPELADGCIEVYFREAEGHGVILVPTEAPLWFDFDADYKVDQTHDSQVTIHQEHQSELFGHVRLSITYEYTNGRWIMIERTAELLT